MNREDKAHALPATVYSSLFGGAGEVRVVSVLRDGSEPFTAALACELSPAGRVGAHRQDEFPELLVGVAGEGEVRVNGVAHTLGAAHAAVHVPLGAALEISNRSANEALRYLIIKARG